VKTDASRRMASQSQNYFRSTDNHVIGSFRPFLHKITHALWHATVRFGCGRKPERIPA